MMQAREVDLEVGVAAFVVDFVPLHLLNPFPHQFQYSKFTIFENRGEEDPLLAGETPKDSACLISNTGK